MTASAYPLKGRVPCVLEGEGEAGWRLVERERQDREGGEAGLGGRRGRMGGAVGWEGGREEQRQGLNSCLPMHQPTHYIHRLTTPVDVTLTKNTYNKDESALCFQCPA